MTRATRTFAALVSFAVLAGVLALPGARAQPPRGNKGADQPVAIPAGGTDLFRALLDKEGVQPVRANENIWFNDDLIVIVIGSTDFFNRDPMDTARQAIRHGGAVLIASESSLRLYESDKNPNWGDRPITQITGTQIIANEGDCYQPDPFGVTHEDTPFVVPISPDERLRKGEKPGRVWNVFRGLTRLATNQSSYINELPEYRNEFQHPLARLPKSSRTLWGAKFNQPPLFAVGGDGFGQFGYSFLAVSDASVYINQMVMEPGTQNLDFALNTIEYLQGPEKHRKRCVFFENGRIIDKFDGLRSALAKPKPRIPPEAVPNIGPIISKNQETLVKMLDARSDALQSNDFLHRTIIGGPGSERERRTVSGFLDVALVLLAVLGCSFLLRRSIAARHPTDVPPPPNTGAGAAATGPPGVFDRRQRELVRRNNLYEPVRNLMREFFESAGAPPNPGPRLPRLSIDTRAVRKPDSLRQALRDMWRIAYGPPAHISAQRWFELEPYFNRLRRAYEEGKWRFDTDDAG
jgi:hypothetical protein